MAADFADATSEETPANAVDAEFMAAGTMTGVTGAKVSWEVGIEADAGRTIEVV